MSEPWMLFASFAELRLYANKRSVQAIYKHINQIKLSEAARNSANYIRKTVQNRASLTPDAA